MGDQDFICNWVGNRQWVDVLPWHGSDRWPAAVEETWVVDGQEVCWGGGLGDKRCEQGVIGKGHKSMPSAEGMLLYIQHWV